jgi:LacI family transcriptional regulator
MPITLKDIAEEVGLSVTTVSRALNDYADVSPQTKERIQQAAQEMGYHPHTIARKLQKRRTDTIGFVIPTAGPRFSDPFFIELITGIGDEAARQEFDLLVSTCAPGDQEAQVYRRLTNGKRVDGLLLVRMRHEDERISLLTSLAAPFVVFGRSDLPLEYPYVEVNSRRGIREITQHLIDLGHCTLAHIAGPSDLMFGTERMQGFTEALASNGIPLDESLVVTGHLTQQSGYEAAHHLLDRERPPTAIVASNDLMAIGAMSAAQERGLIVSRDISITGFDNIPPAAHSHPPLTTVEQPVYDIGVTICRMLCQIIRGEEPVERQVVLEPKLAMRRSTGPPPNLGSVQPGQGSN